ncbi:MAG: type II toxin-antitoxin system PemK/MazF family toxin [Candidatus Rokuibacteriota bacterium]
MAKAAQVIPPRRGEVYLVSLDPAVGAEVRKTRPAVVVQNDPANRRSPITIVAAVTSQFEEPLYPTEVLVRAPEGGLSTDSVVLLNQIRSVDRRRVIRRLGALKSETMREVDRALLLSLGLVEL